MKKQLIWRPESPLRVGEGVKRGYSALPALSERRGHTFAIIIHLPQKLLQGNKREREAQSNPRHSGVSGDTPKSDHGGQTWHCCYWQPEIPAHSVPALCHNMPFPRDGRRFHSSRWQISLRQGTGTKPRGQTRGRVSYTPKNVAMARSAVLRSVSPGCHST